MWSCSFSSAGCSHKGDRFELNLIERFAVSPMQIASSCRHRSNYSTDDDGRVSSGLLHSSSSPALHILQACG